MTVEQVKIIDAIGIDTRTGSVRLTIVDHLEWNFDHLVKLQEKLNSYLAFIESGEIRTEYPASVDRPVVIDLVLNFRPNAEAEAFLVQVGKIIGNAGLAFEYGPLSKGYVDDHG